MCNISYDLLEFVYPPHHNRNNNIYIYIIYINTYITSHAKTPEEYDIYYINPIVCTFILFFPCGTVPRRTGLNNNSSSTLYLHSYYIHTKNIISFFRGYELCSFRSDSCQLADVTCARALCTHTWKIILMKFNTPDELEKRKIVALGIYIYI